MRARKRIERRENLTARVEDRIIAQLQQLADESELTLSTYARYVLLHAAKHRLVVRHSIDAEGVAPENISSRLTPRLRPAETPPPFIAPHRDDDDEPPAEAFRAKT